MATTAAYPQPARYGGQSTGEIEMKFCVHLTNGMKYIIVADSEIDATYKAVKAFGIKSVGHVEILK